MIKNKKQIYFIVQLIIILFINGCSSEVNIVKKQIKQINIISNNEHPKYFDKISKAEEYSKKFQENIVNIKDIGNNDSNTLLCFDGYSVYEEENSIRDIEINFMNLNEDVNEDKVLNIVDEYLPTQILKNYYKRPTYKIICPKKGREGSTYKIIEYVMKDQYINKTLYQGRITIILEEGYNQISKVKITVDLPKWMGIMNQDRNGYESKQWNIIK